ncbi:hypothetical protein [Streptomyces tendae]|uniref:hypothetical protein n=1 Tax=Streptomyces tendae TaxID=1932 RepID=UPI0036515BDA
MYEGRLGCTTRRSRDRDAEREVIREAATRLLTGTPFRSTAGKLTGTELITECGLRRDIVYGDLKARAKAQNFTPQVAQRLAEENAALRDAVAKAKDDLAAAHERIRALVRATAELSLELDQAREELAAAQKVTRLR